jgi:hypothetical protein
MIFQKKKDFVSVTVYDTYWKHRSFETQKGTLAPKEMAQKNLCTTIVQREYSLISNL